MTTGRAALALDDILCKLTPEQAAAFRALTPTWLLDQVDATTDEIRGNMQKARDAGLTQRVGDMPTDQHPGWVRLGLWDALAKWWFGQHSACVHDPNPLRPQPVMSAAWKPGLVVCRDCIHLLNLRDGSVADRTCDGCGRLVSGENDDLMNPFVVTAGVMTYLVGACQDCRYWEEL